MFNYLFIDIDGVMTNGKKIYDSQHFAVYKEFNDKDFTAIDLFRSNGIKVILLTGDKNINEGMAKKRNIDIVITKEWLKVETFNFNNCEKLNLVKEICPNLRKASYIGDDYFDIPVLMNVGFPFCPLDAPKYVQDVARVLNKSGGDGVIASLAEKVIYEYDYRLWK